MNSYNLSIIQGDSFSLDIIVKDDDGNPMNLDGYSLRGKMKSRYSDSSGIAEFGITQGGASGQLSIELDSLVTETLRVYQYLYDVEAYKPENSFKILNGYANVYPEVTT